MFLSCSIFVPSSSACDSNNCTPPHRYPGAQIQPIVRRQRNKKPGHCCPGLSSSNQETAA
jgi:hypothetical protein